MNIKNTKVVLMLAYYFPPYAGVSGFRTSKFVKYLPSSGWNPWVLTVNSRYYGDQVIRTNLKDIQPARIFRIPYLRFPSNVWCVKLLYPLFALLFALKHNRNINAVYMSGSPYHPFILTVILTGLFRIPTLLDFRDSWSINHGFDGRESISLKEKLREHIFGVIEKISIRFATKVVFVTSVLQKEYEQAFPAFSKKYQTIPNGFDPKDFEEITPKRSDNGKTLILTGKFHIYTPDAVDNLMAALRDLPDIHFVYVGNEYEIIRNSARNCSVLHQVTALPYQPNEEVLRLIAGADVGLVTIGMINGLGTKIFEYLALSKPTICLVPDGSVISMEFGNTSSVIISHPPHTKEKIIEALCKAFGMIGIKQQEDLSRFNRIENTKNLAELLNGMTR